MASWKGYQLGFESSYIIKPKFKNILWPLWSTFPFLGMIEVEKIWVTPLELIPFEFASADSKIQFFPFTKQIPALFLIPNFQSQVDLG